MNVNSFVNLTFTKKGNSKFRQTVLLIFSVSCTSHFVSENIFLLSMN